MACKKQVQLKTLFKNTTKNNTANIRQDTSGKLLVVSMNEVTEHSH